MESRFTCVLDVKASLGECPIWSPDEQVLYWVDINAPSLNRFDPRRGTNTAWSMPQGKIWRSIQRGLALAMGTRGGSPPGVGSRSLAAI